MTVVCDFDDTAATQNVAHLLLERFAGGRDQQHVAAFRSGEISFREYQERAFLEVRASIPEMEGHVREFASLRPGFTESVAAARQTGARFLIASAGLEFYIRALLDREGHRDLPVIAVRAAAGGTGGNGGIRYDYPEGQGGCEGDWAICKCKVVKEANVWGGAVVFVGDGTRSDACAAGRADVVFARARLLEHCKAARVHATPFEDLFGLAEFIQRTGP